MTGWECFGVGDYYNHMGARGEGGLMSDGQLCRITTAFFLFFFFFFLFFSAVIDYRRWDVLWLYLGAWDTDKALQPAWEGFNISSKLE